MTTDKKTLVNSELMFVLNLLHVIVPDLSFCLQTWYYD